MRTRPARNPEHVARVPVELEPIELHGVVANRSEIPGEQLHSDGQRVRRCNRRIQRSLGELEGALHGLGQVVAAGRQDEALADQAVHLDLARIGKRCGGGDRLRVARERQEQDESQGCLPGAAPLSATLPHIAARFQSGRGSPALESSVWFSAMSATTSWTTARTGSESRASRR